jgi:hypothetical protein
MSIESIIFYLLLIDSVAANLVAWFEAEWFVKHFRFISRAFPMAKGWTAYYLVLVLFIGFLLYQAGNLWGF